MTLRRATKTHQNGKLTIDREIKKKRGRNAFTLEALETITGADSADVYKKTVAAENKWMNALGTFRTKYGFNFQRADALYRSEEHRQAVAAGMRVAWKRPKEKARRVAALKAGKTWSTATNEKRRRASARIMEDKKKNHPAAWAKQQAAMLKSALSKKRQGGHESGMRSPSHICMACACTRKNVPS